MDFFGFFGPDNLHEGNPLADFLSARATPCSACGQYEAERGGELCAHCERDVETAVAAGLSRIILYLSKHAAFADWEEAHSV